MNNLPLVSIITPVHNGAEYLEELIRSVLKQDYPNIEHLVIDDGSQDGGATVSILQSYCHLRWWSRENKGQYATMNEGLLAAKGEIVCFVSADDILSPGAVKAASHFLSSHENHAGVFGKTGFIDADGIALFNPIPFKRAPISLYPYFAHISHCSLYLKKATIQEHQLLFDPSFLYVGDYEWIIRIAKKRLPLGSINQELSRVRVHANQTSRKFLGKSVIEKKKVLKIQKINPVYYAFLWGLFLFCFRVQKSAGIFQASGIKELIMRIYNYWHR